MKVAYRNLFPWLSAAVLAASAVGDYPARVYVLDGIMLFLPLADQHWRPPALWPPRRHVLGWLAVVLPAAALLAWRPSYADYTAAMLLTAAVPEEWYFRAYFMTRMGRGWRANLVASLLFGFMHGLTWGWTAASLVFFPSLFYGWLYQRTEDVVLLVLVHGLSNLVFAEFLNHPVNQWLMLHGL